jgi:hypothetical protein
MLGYFSPGGEPLKCEDFNILSHKKLPVVNVVITPLFIAIYPHYHTDIKPRIRRLVSVSASYSKDFVAMLS